MTAPLPLWAALVSAAAAGPLLDAAFPDRGWWPLAVPAVVIVLLAAQGRTVGGALLVGLVFGVAFYLPHIEWAAVFLGPVPWSALTAVMALWCAAGTALVALAYRWAPRAWPGAGGRLLLVPAVVAGLWTAREAIASVWPYGGFAWGRVALSQSDSPISPAFAWLGVSGVSFVLVFLAALGLAAVQEGMRALRPRAPGLARGAAADVLLRLAVLVVAAVTVPVSLPTWPAATTGQLRVGAVQGNAKAGYFDPPADRGDNLADQLTATAPILDENLDVVIWPEGGSDLDPFREPAARRAFDRVVEAAGAPLVSGIITARVPTGGDPETDTQYFNTAVLWTEDGPADVYDKKHPVPFGEYVPDRSFWRLFAPELIDLIQREYTPGTTDGVLDLGTAVAGVAICFDIVDDQLMTEMVEHGADIVFAPTNNADFGRTDESVQQLAIARIRAIELARTVVNISTVGTSAIILPDGRILDQLEWYTPGAMVEDVPLATTVTPAVLIGRELEWLVSALGLNGLLVAGRASARRGARGLSA